MFIRKNTKLNTTIFDITKLTTIEKTTLFEDVKSKVKTDANSLYDSSPIVRLSEITTLDERSLSWNHSSKVIRELLFGNIMGIMPDSPNLVKSFSSRIFNQRLLIKRQNVYDNPSISSEKPPNSVLIPEFKTGVLMKQHHEKELKALQKNIIYTQEKDSKERIISVKGTNNYTTKFINELSHLIIVEGVCLLSETGRFINLMYDLHEEDTQFQYSIFDRESSFLYRDRISKINHKYKADVSHLKMQYNYSANNYFETQVLLKLAQEDTNINPIKNELNVFIPVTFYIFLKNADELFLPNIKICMEESNLSHFRDTSNINNLGTPRFTKSGTKQNIKAQTSTSILPLSTTNNNTLNNTIVYIPWTLTQRLLKSKLKTLKDSKLELCEYGDKLYNIPKSILELDFLSSFVFYSKEQTKLINESKNKEIGKWFSIEASNHVNLFYYTDFLQQQLVNRFASNYYKNGTKLIDFAANTRCVYMPTILTEELNLLDQRFDDLEKTFNTENFIVISKDIRYLEKARLLLLHLLKEGISSTFKLEHTQYTECKLPSYLQKSNGVITTDITKEFGTRNFPMIIEGTHKAFMLESLYFIIQDNSNAEITTIINTILEKVQASKSKNLLDFISEINLQRVYSHHIEAVGIYRGLYIKIQLLFAKYNLYRETTAWEVLSKEKSVDLLNLVLSHIVKINMIKDLQTENEILVSVLGRSPNIMRLGVPMQVINTVDLTNLNVFKQVLSERYNNTFDIKCACKLCPALYHTFNENTTLKVTDVNVFVGMFIKNFIAYYLSSQKTDNETSLPT